MMDARPVWMQWIFRAKKKKKKKKKTPLLQLVDTNEYNDKELDKLYTEVNKVG